MDALIGDLLGDGHIRFHSKKANNARMEFTFSTKNLPYLHYLKYVVYSVLCTQSKPTPWPNPKIGKLVSQYWFSTRSLPLFTKLHKEWYKEIDGKNRKIVPLNIKEILRARGLAHWIMGDGYCNNNVISICTDCYTHEEVNLLIKTLDSNFNLKAKLAKRIKENGKVCWIIKFKSASIEKIREIVVPYIIPEILYKLNIK